LTPEHPVFVRNRGWVEARYLEAGDCVRGAAGEWTGIDELVPSDDVEVVWNIQVSRWHTFFVGGEGWGFSVWVHNELICELLSRARNGDAEALAKLKDRLSKPSADDLVQLQDPALRKALQESKLDLPDVRTIRQRADGTWVIEDAAGKQIGPSYITEKEASANLGPKPAQPLPKPTEHGEQRIQEALNGDAHRQVGDRNRVIRQGRKYRDTETGNTVYVDGDRVVINTADGQPHSQFINPKANTLQRIINGKWIAIE
jgi:hypothetical protein